jgi:hypothetical protein
MESITINLTSREYELATEYQDQYHEIFGKWLSLEELLKQAIFINNIKLKQAPKIKGTKQTTLGKGLI